MGGFKAGCSMSGCKNLKRKRKNLSFYRFPKNKEMCQRWVEQCKRQDIEQIFNELGTDYLHTHHCVCSDHFSVKDFRNNNFPSKGIYPGSVPSLENNSQRNSFNGPKKKNYPSPEETITIEEYKKKLAKTQKLLAKYKKKCKEYKKQLDEINAANEEATPEDHTISNGTPVKIEVTKCE